VSFVVCVALCAVFFERGVFCMLYFIVVPLSADKSPFAVQVNNNVIVIINNQFYCLFRTTFLFIDVIFLLVSYLTPSVLCKAE
jgi:hypothetical protein